MKIYFTPREVILNRYNDEDLITDPNIRLQVPPQVKEVQVFSQSLHKLKKVDIPKLAIERMEQIEIDKKDKEYNKLINDNRFIKLKIPGRKLALSKVTSKTKSQIESSPRNQEQKAADELPQEPLGYIQEKELKSKQLREMEERFKKRNDKSKKQVIMKNPLDINDDEYDVKVYKSEIKKDARADEVEDVDEGLQMVFALPSISTKRAKELHKLVLTNVIKEDRDFRTNFAQTERILTNAPNVSISKGAKYNPLEFSYIREKFKKQLHTERKKSPNPKVDESTQNFSLTTSTMNTPFNKSSKHDVDLSKNNSNLQGQSNNSFGRLRRRGTKYMQPIENTLSKMQETVQYFYNPEEDKMILGNNYSQMNTTTFSQLKKAQSTPMLIKGQTFSQEFIKYTLEKANIASSPGSNSNKNGQPSPNQMRKIMFQKQIETQFESEMKKFEDKFPNNRFTKTMEYFSTAYDPQNHDHFKRTVTSRILSHISQAEMREKRQIIGSQGEKRLRQYEAIAKNLSDNVVEKIRQAKLLSLQKRNQLSAIQLPKKVSIFEAITKSDKRSQSNIGPFRY